MSMLLPRLRAARCGWLPCLLCLALLAAGPAQAARKALVIGNNTYERLTPLKNAVPDAEAVARTLREAAGFEVRPQWLVRNGSQRQMRDAINLFLDQIGPGDEVVVFYSGHGMEVDGKALLLPVDLPDVSLRPSDGTLRPLSDAEAAKHQLLDNAMRLDGLAERVAGRGVKFSLLIVDACRDNPVLDYLRRAHAQSPTKGAEPPPLTGVLLGQTPGQVALFSASPGQQSLDRLSNADPVPNGVFTRVLLEVMREPGRSLRQQLPEIRNRVQALAASVRSNGRPHQQTPTSVAPYDTADFYFQPGTVPSGGPDELAWQAAQQAGHAAAFRAYLREFPAGRYAAVARVRLDALTSASGTDTAPLAAPARCIDCPETVVLQPGRFMRGSPEGEAGRDSDEGPVREVGIGYRLAVGKHPVTRAQFGAFVRATGYRTEAEAGDGCTVWKDGTLQQQAGRSWREPGFAQGEDHPVVCVSWNDAQRYVGWLNERSGQKGWRLLTEAEWEYAARAGQSTRYWWGEDADNSQQCRHANGADQMAKRTWNPIWTVANCDDGYAYTSPVGSFKANPWGLYDMGGNVWQWVQDCYVDNVDNYNAAPRDGSAVDSSSCARRVLRGGAWDDGPRGLRAANRFGDTPGDRDNVSGFRVARTL